MNKAKIALDAIDHLKVDLATAKQAWDASYATVTQTQSKAVAVGFQRDKALQDLAELQAMAYGPIYEWVFKNYSRQVVEIRSKAFMKGWLACLTKLGIPKDNPVWAKA